ncbi:hypothetical protein CFC21_101387 [Triticum aestivum]|uniref:Uncharacterized protein n=2 Tax=Triticum aestivum TaxID=4565 RepID=A0A9R1M356_WHEAT|nr:uncharacterized protein LOC123161588 [Triticum aestivum]KAF7099796.1 hypothetical protein CFC21_101387 [Triticum aestivum]
MERSSSSLARSSVALLLLLALLLCSLACSAAVQVSLDGSREGQRPPAPWASGARSKYCPGCSDDGVPPPPAASTSALAPHRKTLGIAAMIPSTVPRVPPTPMLDDLFF